ncbi:MAG: DUF1343 domain-containing protein [Ignavibacteria bacterium]|nr:DUF1343 domain-containing protein [Ignavibacteria bacterium]
MTTGSLKVISIILMFFTAKSITESSGQNFEPNNSGAFKLGNEVLLEMHDSPLKGKRIGIITNNSGVLSDGRLFMDVLNERHKLTKIFTPEHGLRGNEQNDDYTDDVTGAYVVSLYGNREKPSPDDLSDVDILVYDLQDASARFYTFINTLFYCMQAAAENNVEFVVCDRPIIPDGNYVDGFVLEDRFRSFVGMLNVPAAYAMTCGEIASYINSEYLSGKCRLNVIRMNSYKRNTSYDSLGLYWRTPSPNMYFPSTAVAYLGTCLFEGTNVSEGRGSQRPFEYIGAPFCNADLLCSELNSMDLPGVKFEPVSFIPKQLASWMTRPKFADETCYGAYINITDSRRAEPFKIAVAVMLKMKELFPDFSINKNNFIDKLAGTDRLRLMIESGKSYEEITGSFRDEVGSFKTKREKYLMY